jgi:arylsulfatase A-like enzyme
VSGNRLVRYPGKAPAGKQSKEIVHITDMLTTLVPWSGGKIPNDSVIEASSRPQSLNEHIRNAVKELRTGARRALGSLRPSPRARSLS